MALVLQAARRARLSRFSNQREARYAQMKADQTRKEPRCSAEPSLWHYRPSPVIVLALRKDNA